MTESEKNETPGPLSGLKVLDIATVIAGPFAAALLGDYGAEVTKIELPGAGDAIRGFPPFKEGKSLWWKVTNRGKRLVSLDVRKPEGLEVFKKMLPGFDVLVENFRPGTLDGWGLTRELLWQLQPRLVILRVTGFGQDGPYSSRPGFARIFEAMGGLAYITGHADREPLHTAYPVADSIGGVFGAAGILAALWRIARDPQARGEEIDLAMTEATLKLLEVMPIEYDQLGVTRERGGNGNVYSAPSNVYRTSDGRYVSLAGSTQAIFEGNARAIGREDLVSDARYASNAERVRNAQAIDRVFKDWMAAHTCEEVVRAFDAHGGAIAPVYGMDQIFEDAQFRHRKAIVAVPDADFGSVAMSNVVPRFVQTPGHIRGAAGALGRDNEAVYTALGYSHEEIQALRARKAI